MKVVPRIGDRVIVSKIPANWGPDARTWVGTSGIVRRVSFTYKLLPVVAVDFPGWDGGHTCGGILSRPAGWYFILDWLEYSGG